MKFGNYFKCVSILFGIMYSPYMAQGVVFSKVGGDLANEDDWGSNTLLSSSYIDFVSSGTYYASADLACRLFRVKNASDVVIDAADKATITINQQSGDASVVLLPKDNSSLTFKGGLWNAGGGTTAHLRCCSAVDSGEAATNRTVSIEGGAVVTNIANVYCAGGNNANVSTRLSYCAFNTLQVSGAGTRLHADLYFGSYAYVNDSVQSNNTLCIRDGAQVVLSGTCATDASSVATSKLSGNVICVSNATLKLTRTGGRPLLVGNSSGSTGNRFILSGQNAVLDVDYNSEWDFFAASSSLTAGGNEVVIADGASFVRVQNFGLFNVAHGETLRVTGGSTFGLSDPSINYFFSVGRWDAASSNNTLIVEDESTLQVNYLRVTCRENALVISNATVTCASSQSEGNDQACTIGYYLADRSPKDGVTGNRLVMRGNKPALRALNGGVLFRYAAECVFDVPIEGYAEHACADQGRVV